MMDENTTERLAIQAAELAQEARRLPCLIAVKGPEKGATFPLREGEAVLGRSGEKADIVLIGNGLSRAHARLLVAADGTVQVKDLASTNGVFVNGKRAVDQTALQKGDVLGLGPEVDLELDYPNEKLAEVFQDLYRGANLDQLTNVLNRRAVMARLDEEWASGCRHNYPSCIAMVDVDHFKSINDRYGHPAGDAVLVTLGRILRQALRTEDLVGRYGGEEFLLFLRYADLAPARAVLERLRFQVESTPFEVPVGPQRETLKVTISLGLARLTPERQVHQALALADQALYNAKRSGRNRLCEDPA